MHMTLQYSEKLLFHQNGKIEIYDIETKTRTTIHETKAFLSMFYLENGSIVIVELDRTLDDIYDCNVRFINDKNTKVLTTFQSKYLYSFNAIRLLPKSLLLAVTEYSYNYLSNMFKTSYIIESASRIQNEMFLLGKHLAMFQLKNEIIIFLLDNTEKIVCYSTNYELEDTIEKYSEMTQRLNRNSTIYLMNTKDNNFTVGVDSYDYDTQRNTIQIINSKGEILFKHTFPGMVWVNYDRYENELICVGSAAYEFRFYRIFLDQNTYKMTKPTIQYPPSTSSLTSRLIVTRTKIIVPYDNILYDKRTFEYQYRINVPNTFPFNFIEYDDYSNWHDKMLQILLEISSLAMINKDILKIVLSYID
jgi:hypothetical protein